MDDTARSTSAIGGLAPAVPIGTALDEQLGIGFERAMLGMVVLGVPDGHFLRANGSACELLGRTEDELRRTTWRELAGTGPDAEAIPGGGAPTDGQRDGQRDGACAEHHFRRPDGRDVWAETRSGPVAVGGGTVGWLVQLRDVSAQKLAEQTKLRDARTFRDVVRSIPDTAFMLFDHDMRFWFAEGELLRAAGWGPEVAEGRTLGELVPDEYRELLLGHYRSALRGERSHLRSASPTGTPYELTFGPLRDQDGSILGGMVITRDLSERERAQAELNRERDLASAVLDTSGALVVVLDRQGRVVRFNRTCETLSGLRADEVLGRPFWEFMIPLDELVATKASFGRLTAGDYPSSHESSFVARDGGLRTIVWSNTALVDDDGGVEYVIGTGIDVTDQRAAQDELARTQAQALVEAERFAAVLRAATGYAIIGTDLNGRINVYNEGAERMLGWMAHQVVGQFTLDALLDPGEVAVQAATLGVRLGFEVLVTRARRGRPETREWTSVRADGSRLPVSLSVSPMRDDQGKLRGFIGIAEDITTRRQLEADAERLLLLEQTARANSDAAAAALAAQNERLRELDTMKDEFVSTVSHELRTPLTSMHGYLELLLEGDAGPITDRQLHFLQVIDRNSRRLLRLVDDLLFVASTGAGKLTLELREADLNLIVGERTGTLRASTAAKSIELAVDAEPLPTISADPDRLGQLVDHLLTNAIKFTPEGGRIEVTTSAVGGQIVLTVADTGIGIPAEQLGNLFQRFARAAAASEQAVQGSGLGLVITKAIAEAHGGTIEVSSIEGQGTAFQVTLPVSPAAGGAEAGSS